MVPVPVLADAMQRRQQIVKRGRISDPRLKIQIPAVWSPIEASQSFDGCEFQNFHVHIAVFALFVDQLWTTCGYTYFAFCDEQSVESVFEQGPARVSHRSWPGYREP